MTVAAGRDNRLSSRSRRRVRCRSVEEETRLIKPGQIEGEPVPAKGLGTALHELFKPLGGVELALPPREPMREPPRFE